MFFDRGAALGCSWQLLQNLRFVVNSRDNEGVGENHVTRGTHYAATNLPKKKNDILSLPKYQVVCETMGWQHHHS